MRPFLLCPALCLVVACPRVSRAQGAECDTTVSRTTLAAFSGARIAAVDVTTLGPQPLGGFAGLATRLHWRTREATVRRQLRFAVGDTIDTLAVGESMRRLRALRYLGDAEIAGVRCGDGAARLQVTTRDLLSARPVMQVRGNAQSVFGVSDRNVLGSGREGAILVRTDAGRTGLGVAWRDPWMAGSPLALSVGSDGYRDGSAWHASLGSTERSVLDPLRVTLDAAGSIRRSPDGSGDDVRRETVIALADVRIGEAGASVPYLVAGAEAEKTSLAAAHDAVLVGPEQVHRRFAGVDLGAGRRAVAYDTLTWMLPGGAIVDVPGTSEGELVVGVGRDLVAGTPVLHLDGWIGKSWLAGTSSLVSGDLWGSGYAWPGTWSGGMFRGALAWTLAAPRGRWSARLSGQRLMRPDPDLRTLATDDRTVPLLPTALRLSHSALAGDVEREVDLRRLSRSWSLGAGFFAASSARWDTPTATSEVTGTLVLGADLRLVPRRAGRGTARLDVGYPLFASAGVRRRFYAGVSLAPWFDAIRHRDGRRTY
jgi:hypothetical protein